MLIFQYFNVYVLFFFYLFNLDLQTIFERLQSVGLFFNIYHILVDNV